MEIEIEIRVMLLTMRFLEARPGHNLDSMENLGSLKLFQTLLEKVRYISYFENFVHVIKFGLRKGKNLCEVFEFS